MLFNEKVIKNKVKYLDAILHQEDLLRKVINDFSRGQQYNYRLVERIWNPGGGATLFVVTIGKEKYFLKVKYTDLFVESKLEAEATFAQISSLKNEFNFLQKVKNISSYVPQFFNYVEENGWSFLFIEYLETFETVVNSLNATELLEVYQAIAHTVHQLYDNNIVHTDIHENNIMFRGRNPILVDFEEAKLISQGVPFEESLDVCGENVWGNVGYFPEGHSPISGFTCLNRLKLVFKNLITSKLGDLIKECHFDSSCPFLTALDHGKDERIYQSINIPGLTIAGQRSLYDDRVAFILNVASKLFQESFTHLDIGSNLGRFNLELSQSKKVRKSIGVEAYDKYVELSKILAFLSDSVNVEFIQAVGGQDSLVELLRGQKIDLVTIYSVYHHIQNKEAFLKDLIALQPAYLLFEMPVQRECYGGKSWEEEISLIAQKMGMPYWYLLSHTHDYNRPIVLVSKKQLSHRPSKPGSVLPLNEINRPYSGTQKLPLVSVVLPTYNHLKFLPQAVQSVLAQTFHNFELIIVNDGSTDGTKEYLDTLNNPRIRVIHQENKRLPGALNTGFQAAQGELLTWVSSDNYCSPVFLEALVGALQAFPEAGFAYSMFAWIDEQDRITRLNQNDNLTYRRLLSSNPGIASFMYRRECHEEVGWYAPELEGAEDWDMWLRILEHYPVVYVPEILYYYRLHRQSMTAQIPEKVHRASHQVVLRALNRHNNELELTNLYPTLNFCQNQNLARLHAAFDFGTLLLQSPFTSPLLASRVLEMALAASPHSFEIMSNLAIAYARAAQWDKVMPLLPELRRAEHPVARQVVELVETAYQQNKPKVLARVPLYSIDQTSAELFILEQKQKRVFSLTATTSTISSPKVNKSPSTSDTAWPIEVTRLVQHADQYFAQGDLNAAIDTLKQALDIIPDDPQLIVALGNLWLGLGEIDTARREFVKAAVIHPDYSPAHAHLAAVQLHLGLLDQAEVSARRALVLKPTDTDTLKVWAQLCLKQERYDEAIQTYVNILRDHPGDVDALLALANCYVEIKDWSSALEFYRRVLQLSGDSPSLAEPLQETIAKLQTLVEEAGQEKISQNGRTPSKQPQPTLVPAIESCPTSQGNLSLSQEAQPSPKRGESDLAVQAKTASPPSSLSKISFCIITAGTRPKLLNLVIKSIQAQNISNYEIIVVGRHTPEPGIIYVPAEEAADCGHLGRMRNLGVTRAQYNHIVILDDDILLTSTWYQALLDFGDNFDILTSRILLPDGTRYWDHATIDGPKGQILLQSNEQDDQYVYMSGGTAWVMKDYVARSVFWNETLKFYQKEDVDFTRKCQQKGFCISYNPNSVAYHCAAKYTRLGRLVLMRKPEHSNFWLSSRSEPQDPNALYQLSQEKAAKHEIAELADCLRTGIQLFPHDLRFRRIWQELEQGCGGDALGDCYYPGGDPQLAELINILEQTNAPFIASSSDSDPDNPPVPTFQTANINSSKSASDVFGINGQQPNSTASTINWEGSQFVTHSLALINREVCLRLAQQADIELSIIPYETHQFGPEADPRFRHIADHLNRPLSRPADVHVRHQWPPNLTPPPQGHWVMIQPWEFGSLPKEWIEVMREKVDEVWAYTNYVRDCYLRSGLPEDRVFVVAPGVNTTIFCPEAPPLPLKTRKRFKLLFVGGTIARKGIDLLLNVYAKTFTIADDICLVIKDMGGQSFYQGQTAQEIIAKIKTVPNAPEIEYLDQTLTDQELAGLYTACNCLVHPYRGEGFGLPIAEAMACALPVIVTGYGAALDFCHSDNAYLIPAEIVQMPQKRIGERETVDYPWWAEPNIDALQLLLRRVFAHPDEAKAKGQQAMAYIRANFTWEHTVNTVQERIRILRSKPIHRLVSAKLSLQNGHPANDVPQSDIIVAQEATKQILAAGQSALEQGDLERAAREFAWVTARYPDLAAGHTALGGTLMALGYVKSAVTPFRRVTELLPHLTTAHNQLGVVLYRLGQMAEAETAFQTARQVAPDNLESRLNLIDLYREQQAYEEASIIIKEALTIDSNHPEVLLTFAVFCIELGDVEGAQMAWRRLQSAHPDHPGVVALAEALGNVPSVQPNIPDLLTQIEAAQANGAWPQAINLLEQALQVGPALNGDEAPLWNRLGYCHFMNNQLAEAESAFQHGLGLAPDNRDLLGNLADLYLGQERFDQATQYLKQALQIDPDDVNTLLTFGNCSIQLGVFDSALLAFRRVQNLAPYTEGVDEVVQQLEAIAANVVAQ